MTDSSPFSIKGFSLFLQMFVHQNVPKWKMSVAKPYSLCICTVMPKGPGRSLRIWKKQIQPGSRNSAVTFRWLVTHGSHSTQEMTTRSKSKWADFTKHAQTITFHWLNTCKSQCLQLLFQVKEILNLQGEHWKIFCWVLLDISSWFSLSYRYSNTVPALISLNFLGISAKPQLAPHIH